MRRLNVLSVVIGLLLSLEGASSAVAQCTGQPASGRICGNSTAATGLPAWITESASLDRNFGGPSVQGTILNRGVSLWSSTSSPSLGLNGTAGGSLTLNGSSTGSAVIGVKAAAGSTIFNMPVGNGSVNQVLQTDGSGNTSWVTVSGTGTVTSVGLALPASILTVSGSPVTATGTLTGTLATQTANTVWAGPTTGSAATPTFRALVGADLPNPAASTLGGIQSAAAVSHEWINSISTGGVPALSQPAFTDISGTITAAQCPNPSASTIGCVESLAVVTSKWINTISTAGVPSATQPAFTDISGNATLGQLPSIGSNTILSNITGGTTTPLGNSLTSIIDSSIDNTQGDVLYRSGTVWTALSPGTSGQVLTTAGASANPSWTTVTGTGTVTSVATNNGITGGTITTTGTIGLATIATGNVLANTSGGSAVPTANTPTKVLDVIGATEGDVLYRGASVWTALAPGTNGQFLQTTGAGSTPQWASAGTLTNVTISAGTGMGTFTGTCNISTTGTCTIVGSGAQLPGTTTNDNATAGNVGEYVSTIASTAPSTVTITIASPAVITWTANGFANSPIDGSVCTPVTFTTTGALPTGLTVGTPYYIIGSTITTNTFEVATSVANCIAGTPVNTTGTQSGTHTGTNSVTLATGTVTNVTGVSLTAGDWDVWGEVANAPVTATIYTLNVAQVGTGSASVGGIGSPGRTDCAYGGSSGFTGNATVNVCAVLPRRISLSGTTTVYLVADDFFSGAGGTMAASGYIAARRRR